MAQKLRIKNGLHLCALSALCLVTLHRASATSPMRPNDQEVEKEIDIVGRSASIVKDFSLPGYDGGDSTPEPSCISKKDGITRPSLNNDAFNRCEKRHEQCSITGIREDTKSPHFRQGDELEITEARSNFDKRIPVIGKILKDEGSNRIFIDLKEGSKRLMLGCESKNLMKSMKLADAQDIIGAYISLPEEREQIDGHAKEKPPHDGSAAGYVH